MKKRCGGRSNYTEEKKARVIPVVVRDVNWKIAPLAKLQALPKDGKAVMTWANKDTAWKNVSEGIQKVAEGISTAGTSRRRAR